MRFSCALSSLCLFAFTAAAQTVISVNSGVIHFSEGAVFVDGNKLEQKFGSFPSLANGSVVKTEEGRVEVLLTPGVVLRLDHNSSVRMVSNALASTQLDFLKGSIIVDSAEAQTGKGPVIKCGPNEVTFPQAGVYRIDEEPATLQVYSGEAEISNAGKKTSIDSSHLYFLDAELDTPKYDDGTEDEFYRWAHDRSETILADNRLANQTKEQGSDPDAADNDDADDDAFAGPVPGFGGNLPGYSYPGVTPPLSSPVPSPYPSPGYSYPLYSAFSPFGFSPFGMYGSYPYTPAPIYVVPYIYRHRPLPPGVSQSQYWRDRLRQRQTIVSNPAWQYRHSPWPVNPAGITRPAFSGSVPVHTYVPRSTYVPRTAAAPVTIHPVAPASHPVGIHPVGRR